MRHRSTFVGIVLALAMTIPNVGHAVPSPGVGGIQFTCQIALLWPVAVPTPAKTRCDGVANGALAGTGKDNVYTAVGGVFNPLAKKPQGQGVFVNFEAYNIIYNNVFIPGEIQPSMGTASGYAFINFRSPITGAPTAVILGFDYARLGIFWVALLTSVTVRNVNFAQNDTPIPLGIGTGAAAGLFLPKPGKGTWAAPANSQFIITGGAGFTF